MALLKTNTGIGITNPSEALHVIGNGLFEGIVSATSFTGNLSGTATSAINLVGGQQGSVPYQSSTNSTTFLSPGSSGQVLLTGGSGQNPYWAPVSSAAGSFGGITIQDEGDVVGSALSISSLNFVGSNITATGSGIAATITIANNLVGTALSISGISTFTNGPVLIGSGTSTGTATQPLQVTGGAYVSGNLGIGTTTPTSKLQVVGDVLVSGIVTATTFNGALTGSITGNAASADKLFTPRTISLTGDVAGSVSFDGSTDVSIASTIQPNSVGLGTDTFGDYVKDITGTSNQITVTSGTGEGSTPTLSIPNQFTVPQDLTVIRDVQINRNLNVNGNITIGGTSATIFSQSLNVFDPDIVLGYRTDANGNDISTDNTANHGGVAIASTEGSPLVQLFIAGIETNPATYKKIMWFKAGTFAGLGTDAWLSNYAIGIGSTQFPTGTRLAAGSVQFTENDLAVVRNINASGIITATTFVGSFQGNVTTATYATNAGVATNLNGGASGSIPYQYSSGITSFLSGSSNNGWILTYDTATNAPIWSDPSSGVIVGTANYAINAGIATYATNAGIATYATNAGIATYAVVAGIATYATNAGIATYATNAGIATYAVVAGIATYATNAGIATYATNAGIATYATNAGIATYATNAGIATYATNAGIATYAVVAGIATYATNAGIATYATNAGIATYATNAGIATYATNAGIATYATNAGIATYATNAGIATYATNAGIATYATNAGIATNVIGGIGSITQLQVTGISTFINGPVLIGSGTSTGTASQPLQVTGGAYVSGSVGIGTTNPTQSLHVQGSARLTGALYDSSNLSGSSGQILSSTESAIQWINASSANVGSANSIAIAADSTNASRHLTFVSTTSGNNVVYVDSDLLYNPSTNSLAINNTSFTGTASQNLQVTGGAYVSGSVGIGTTNPTSTLQVQGTVSVSSTTTSAEFVGGGSDLRNLSGTHLVSYASASDISNSALSIAGISTYNQVGILTGSLAVDASDSFGYSVATSADGKTIVVGAHFDEIGATTSTGVVYVFDRIGNSFNQVGILTGSLAVDASDRFGWSVATSADGKTIIVGVAFDEIGATTGTGVAYVYDRVGSSFNQVGILTGSLAVDASDTFGRSVATSADGKTIIVGAAFDEIGATSATGVVYVFDRVGSSFNQVGILTGSLAVDASDLFGYSVATSADGKTIIVGATLDEIGATTSTGVVYVFDRIGNSFNQVGILTGSLAVDAADQFGISVATSADGKTIIVGANTDEIGATTSTGVVYVYDRVGSSFNQVGILTGSLAVDANDIFGQSVATSADGKTIIVGAALDEIGATTSTGVAYIFKRQGNSFNQVGILTGSLAVDANDIFGQSVATSADGKTIIVGAYNDEIGATAGTGVVYVFDETRDTYVYSGPTGNIGIGTTTPTSKLHIIGDVLVSGVITATTFFGNLTGYASTAGIATYATNAGIATYATNAGISTNVIGGIGSITQLQVTGISTFTNGPVLVGAATSTGTSAQRLQVTGGTYVSGNLGIGTTNPTSKLQVQGDVSIASTVGIGTVIDIVPYDTLNSGTLSFEGSAGQLFSITNNLTSGSIFSVNDVSGIPSIDVDANGTVSLVAYGGNVAIGSTGLTGTSNQKLQVTGDGYVSGSLGIGTTNPSQSLHVQGNARLTGALYDGSNVAGTSGQILSSTGSAISWINPNTTNVGSANSIAITLDSTDASRYLTFVSTTSGNNVVYVDSDLLYNPSTNSLAINSTSFTGTTSQTLQVTGGAYVSGNIGVGTTNPQQKLDVVGTIRMSAVPGTNTNADLPVLFQTTSGNIDGGSSLTFNPGGDSLIINGMLINTNTVRGNASSLTLTTQNGSGTIDLIISNTDIKSKSNFLPNANNTYDLGSSSNLWRYGYYNGAVFVGSGTSTGTASQPLQVTGGAYVSGNVGIGTTLPQYKLHVVGDFGATTKSFVIPHPTKPGMTLRHGSLEGAENGVYVRGKTTESIIPLPDYWTGLVDEESITVNLTPKNGKLHSVVGISSNTVEIECVGGEVDCYFMILGERKDVAKLVAEY